MLWVDKYKPTSTLDLVGNPGHIKTLAAWLKGWEAVHLRGQAAGTSGGGAKPKDLGKKAVLLSGPPGVGKTSAAHIIAKWVALLQTCLYCVLKMEDSMCSAVLFRSSQIDLCEKC